MTTIKLTHDSAGAPTLNNVNGSLCAVLDWALPQAGWSILFSSGNARVYETVNGELLHIYNDSSVAGFGGHAVVRGCEGAASATSLVDPYPTVTQMANNLASWRVANSSSARLFHLCITDDFLVLLVESITGSGIYESYWFGRPLTEENGPHDCVVFVRNSSTNAASDASFNTTSNYASSVGTASEVFWKRSIDGSIKSSRGSIWGSPISGVGNAPVPRGGYLNRIVRDPIPVMDIGSASTTPGPLAIVRRGYLPQLWNALHAAGGGVTEADVFEDAAYDPAARFRYFPGSVIVEETDTWVPY